MMTKTKSNNESPMLEEQTKPPFLRRVRIEGYKSIGICDVALKPLTFLVGRNAAGKSNFLDALSFVRDSIHFNIDEAIRRHGPANAIFCRSSEKKSFTIELEMGCPSPGLEDEFTTEYRLTIDGPASGNARDYSCEESLKIRYPLLEGDSKAVRHGTRVDYHGPAFAGLNRLPLFVPRDHPFIGQFMELPLLELTEGLKAMGFYNFNPEKIREFRPSAPGYYLDRDGGNLGDVIEMLGENDPVLLNRCKEYLSVIVPEIVNFKPINLKEFITIFFQVRPVSNSNVIPLEFSAESMSDGTLRVLATLLAGSQVVLPYGHPSLIGIEEPETSLHPAATQALVDALEEATEHTQVLVTTHSPDFLGCRDFQTSQVLLVRNREGTTQIGPLDPSRLEIVHKELYSLGDLQRMDQLDLDEEDLRRQLSRQRNGVQ